MDRYETVRLMFQNPVWYGLATWSSETSTAETLLQSLSDFMDGTGVGSPNPKSAISGTNVLSLRPGLSGVVRVGWSVGTHATDYKLTPKLTTSGNRLLLDDETYRAVGGSGTLQHTLDSRPTATLRTRFVI
jgi:hypothetical protein